MDLDTLAREIARLLRRDNVVFFLGVGASLGTSEEQAEGKSLHSSSDLARAIIDEFNLDIKTSDLRDAASLAAQFGPMAVKNYVAREIRNRSRYLLRAHKALARIYPPLVVTTNYDDLYEKALDDLGKDYEKVVRQENLSYSPRMRRTIIKLHGDVHDPNSLTLTGDDYLEWQSSAAALFVDVASEFQRSPCLFIGYSLTDENLRAIVSSVRSKLGRNAPRHFALIDKVDKAKAAGFGESVTFVQGDATELLEKLAQLWEAERPPPVDLLGEQQRLSELIEAGDFEKATVACQRLENEFRSNNAFGIAAARWTDLAKAAESTSRPDVAAVAYTEAGSLYLEARDDLSAESSLEHARENARAANMPSQEREILPSLYQAWLSRGNYYELLQETHDVLQAIGTDTSPDQVYVLYSGRADAKEAMGDDEGALEELRTALRLIPREASFLRSRLRCTVARILATRAEWASAREELDRGDAELSDVSDTEHSEIRRGAASIQLVRANLHHMLGEDLKATELYAECVETFEETGDTAFLISALQGSNHCRVLIGDFDVGVARSQLRDLIRESPEHGRIREQEQQGIAALADDELVEASSSLLQAMTGAYAVHSVMSERRIRHWYADVLHTGQDFRGALQQYVLAGDRKKSSEVAKLLRNSPIVDRTLFEQVIADTNTVASKDNVIARGAALTALTAAVDMLPEDVVNDLAENLSSMDQLPAGFFAERNLLSEAAELVTPIMPLLSDEQALSVGRGIVRAILRTDCSRPTYQYLCSALSSLAFHHARVVEELEVPVERLVELIHGDLINDTQNAMEALVNLAHAGHADARERALELARGGNSPWHVRWRQWLEDVSQEELTATIRTILSQSIDRVRQTEEGFQLGIGGLSPMFIRDWSLPEEVRAEVVVVLSEAVIDPSVLIRDRQEAATMLGLKADQFDDEGQRRAIEVLTPLLTEEVDVHHVARSIDSPLSAIRMNVGQPQDIKAAAAYSLLRLSDWMTENQRRLLMREIEKLRASQNEVFGTSVSGGLRYFRPRSGNGEEQQWLQTRLLLLMNSPHTAVRENAAKCVGLMVEEGILAFNPELIDTLLFLASSPLVADRTGAAFALPRIIREEPWSRPRVVDAIEDLVKDASYFVRRSAHRPDESAVQS